MELVDILDAVQTIAMVVLPVIGITGGLKGLIKGLPAFEWSGIAVPGGLWMSWLVAGAWVGARVLLGYDAPDPSADPAIWFAARWAAVAATANIVRNWVKGTPTLAALGVRRAA